MKYLLSIAAIFLLVFSTPALAKNSTGGQPADPEPVTTAPAPDPAPVVAPSTSEEASEPEEAKQAQETEKVEETLTEEEDVAPPDPTTLNSGYVLPLPPAEDSPASLYAKCVVRGKVDLRDGVICFDELPAEKSKALFDQWRQEYNRTQSIPTGYQPLGCLYRSYVNKKCQQVYWDLWLAGAYEQPLGQARIEAFKKVLGLPSRLVPIGELCGQHSECYIEYREQIKWLVGARLYDAEERAEHWYEEGQITQEQFYDAMVRILEAKHQFYSSHTVLDQKQAVEGLISFWKDFLKQVQR